MAMIFLTSKVQKACTSFSFNDHTFLTDTISAQPRFRVQYVNTDGDALPEIIGLVCCLYA